MFKIDDYIAHYNKNIQATHPLSSHLEDVSEKAGEFASKIGLKEYGEIIGLLHDIGKASDEFTKYIKSAEGLIDSDADDYVDAGKMKGKVDHSSAGAQLIYQNIPQKEKRDFLLIAETLSLCIASHHSGMIDCISPEGKDSYSKRMLKNEIKTHVNEVIARLDEEKREHITKRLKSEDFSLNLIKRFNGLRTDNDSKETLAFKCGLLVRFLFSCLIDADRLNTADFEVPDAAKLRNNVKYNNWPELKDRFENNLMDFRPVGINAVRNNISQKCYEFSNRPTGLYQLTVPTGGGKTLASLRFALHHANKHSLERIIYVVPYTTIIDQNADVIRKIIETEIDKGFIVLEHHSNLMPENETARQKVLSENWDAPIVMTTNVQVLETLFGSGTRGARRMHQLAKAVIIFDEIQNLPIRCVHMFNTAVNFLINNCGSTVVLCTATQPLLDRIEPVQRALDIKAEQQMVSNAAELFSELKRVNVYDRTKRGGWSDDEIVELVGRQLSKASSVLIVVNTKRSSKQLYQKCKQSLGVDTFHLSTNMCPAHRMDTLNKVKELLPNSPVVCVSTQLIEAGVDISFGSVIRCLAGFDSIMQAAGRCNRNNEIQSLGDVIIVNPKEENLDKLPEINEAKRQAERVLREFKEYPEQFDNDLLSLKVIELYYRYYFYDRKDDMCYPVDHKSKLGLDDDLFNLLSLNGRSVKEFRRINKGHLPEIPLRQAFMSAAKSFKAIDSNTRGIVVPYGREGKMLIGKLCSEFKADQLYKYLREAQRYSVNIFHDKLGKMLTNDIIHEVQKETEIYHLDERYYCDDFGLSDDAVNEMEFLMSD
ncbi:CRISPR-associated helicase/endonuclease Cas3 [Candidatus Magnetominusculus xianensis]|uniref:CRISPR-associated helicase/endonuclease Cas3 n=1 Tax=Candidatus Magnetominusculus xianensis TaxID=1748249 RepID=A0ABR5SDV5_9BACT|nr:CRISPR-associated helicase/endonuclease Cas3 [Candidatus Magnetominusculus xianensis]KWT83493.1 CRISPR-associated helicase/endonuclease Cas3 [Candidatus Magnetominusculus xianensis]MBF0404133.1 CRISPR-associated helicase/endonuclease Cas3 [Nitrospirota bacterium]